MFGKTEQLRLTRVRRPCTEHRLHVNPGSDSGSVVNHKHVVNDRLRLRRKDEHHFRSST